MNKLPAFFFVCLMLGFLVSGCTKSEEENAAESKTGESTYRENEQSNIMLIEPGTGVGKVRLGMTVEEMKSCLGKPDIDATGISFVYADLGIEVVIRGEKVYQIYCVHHINNAPAVKACKYKTAEGIGIGSTESEIISTYGEPYKRGESALSFITYNELGMRFELDNDQVVLILVLNPW